MSGYRFHHIGLLVTGDAEADCLPTLLGGALAVATGGRCTVRTIAKVQQLRARHSGARERPRVVGTTKALPTRDDEIAFKARRYITAHPDGFVVLVDDEEHRAHERLDGRPANELDYARYRDAFDRVLGDRSARVAVHVLRSMLEAYYFTAPDTVAAVLGVPCPSGPLDVETIRHPKGDLKAACRAIGRKFHEKDDGAAIIAQLDLEAILAAPHACASLRSLVAWCVKAVLGGTPTDVIGWRGGCIDRVTGPQLARLP